MEPALSLERMIRNFSLQNAIQYGEPNPKAVMGKVIAENRELRSRAKEIMDLVRAACLEIAPMEMDDMKEELAFHAPELLEKKEHVKDMELPDLPNVNGNVVMRFAPGPSGPLHLGHSRAAIINDEFVKRYGGSYILRIEDTNPSKILPEAYDMIPEDMEWLGTKIHSTIIQSDRFDLYLKYARELIEGGHAYICTCQVETWRSLKEHNKACPHRELDPGEQLEEWTKMLSGYYDEGEASLMVKTDLDHPNPAVRDFVGMRILDHPHPRAGDRYRIYPLYNFSVAVDDHLLEMTHVLRGKDQLNNTYKQKFIYNHFRWDLPTFIHYGWVSIPDTLLKTSLINQGILSGEYTDWADTRLGTFRALEKRGFHPEAIRRYWVEVGMKEVDIKFSWKNLIAYNKEIIDPISPRFFFVSDPVPLTVTNIQELTGRAPYFPDRPEAGTRDVHLISDGIGIRLFITQEDAELLKPENRVRLKDLGNVKILETGVKGIAAEYSGNDLTILKQGARNIHWCPSNGVSTVVHMNDGREIMGLTEQGVLETSSENVQFERFGFVRIEKTGDGIEGYFTHK